MSDIGVPLNVQIRPPPRIPRRGCSGFWLSTWRGIRNGDGRRGKRWSYVLLSGLLRRAHLSLRLGLHLDGLRRRHDVDMWRSKISEFRLGRKLIEDWKRDAKGMEIEGKGQPAQAEAFRAF